MAENEYYSQSTLSRLKTNISTSYLYFQDNCKRFKDFKRYVFCESVTEDQRAVLRQLNRPANEANILEAFISRLIGEFSKHEPSISVTPRADVPVSSELCKIIENNIRFTMYQANRSSFSDKIYRDSLAGGFSVGKVIPDYENNMSMKQIIKWSKCFDSTLCCFDPLARAPHKGDGDYCAELYPMFVEDFKTQFPKIDVSDMDFERDIESFNWTYEDALSRKTILVCDYYEKKKKNIKIVELANGVTMPQTKYNKLQKMWIEEGIIEQIPVIVGSRKTISEVICHYKFVDSKIIEYRETDWLMLPLVFFDGNSEELSKGMSATQSYQMTRPYVYHARGIQDLKNFALQTVCNSLQTQVQHKFIVMKEAIPQEQDYKEALINPQRANTLVVNAYSENNPDKPIPQPIREVQIMPLPPEVLAAFSITDPTTQVILGSFASNMAENLNNVSGKAIIESISVDNAAAMPYVMGYLCGLNRMAEIHVSLLPKYILGKRKLPMRDNAGENDYAEVNTAEKLMLNYEDHSLQVFVEAGVNFQIQKNQALSQITSLMQASEEFSAFMNDDETLPILVDNLTVYGSDRLKEAVPKWIEKKQKMQQQAQQQQQEAMQNDPALLRAKAEMLKIQEKAQQDQVDNQIAIAQLQIDKELAEAKLMEAESKITGAHIDQVLKMEQEETSKFNHQIDSATKIAEIDFKEHQMKMDHNHLDLEHRKLDEAKKEPKHVDEI